MLPPTGLHRAKKDLDFEITAAVERGYRVFLLPDSIRTIGDFFQRVREVLPLNPPVQTNHWDALADSLWTGLHDLESERIAIVWPKSRTMELVSRADFQIAREILEDLTLSLADEEATVGRPKELLVILA